MEFRVFFFSRNRLICHFYNGKEVIKLKKVLYILQQSVVFSIISICYIIICYIIEKLTDVVGKKLINYLDDPFNE